MSRTIAVEVLSKKVVAHRALRARMDETRNALEEADEPVPPAMLRALNAGQLAANKLITAAGRADVLEILVLISETPLGGWQASVQVGVKAPTYREG